MVQPERDVHVLEVGPERLRKAADVDQQLAAVEGTGRAGAEHLTALQALSGEQLTVAELAGEAAGRVAGDRRQAVVQQVGAAVAGDDDGKLGGHGQRVVGFTPAGPADRARAECSSRCRARTPRPRTRSAANDRSRAKWPAASNR